MSFFQPQQEWAGFSRLTAEQQRRYAKLDEMRRNLVQFHFEHLWKIERIRAAQARSPWQKWKSATLELLRWWWSFLA